MKTEKKLKPILTPGRIGWACAGSVLVLGTILIIRFFYGADVVFLLGALYPLAASVWSIVLLLRTQNPYFIIPLLMFIFYAAANLTRVFYDESLAELFLFTFLLFAIGFMVILMRKKIKSRYREILEMAAAAVPDNLDGFTSRPFAAGRITYSPAELRNFSRFLMKHQIAVPYFEGKDTVFLLEYSFWHLSCLKNDYSKFTRVIFKSDGKVMVVISKTSYLKYRDELTFDKLCASLGDLFKEFFELFLANQKQDILKRMDSMKV